MVHRLPVLMLMLLTALLPLAAVAAPLRFQCDSYLEHGGEHTRRLMTMDLDRGTVVDGAMQFQDGAAVLMHGSPLRLASPSISFVRRDGPRVEWGTRDARTAEVINGFSLDLGSGAYMFSAPGQTFARGRCRPLPDSI